MGSMGVLIKSQSQILEKLTYHMHFRQYFTHHKFKCKTSHLTLLCLSVKLTHHILILGLIDSHVSLAPKIARSSIGKSRTL